MRVSVPKEPAGRLSDAWRYCVGTGRFELALRRDYQDSLALVQREIGFRHIRAAPAGHTVALSIPLDPPQGTAFALRSSVSDEAGNAWAAWSAMGRPPSPDRRQLDALRELAEPARRHQTLPIADGRVDLDLTLDRHEVTLVEITPVTDETPPWWDEGRLLGTGDE